MIWSRTFFSVIAIATPHRTLTLITCSFIIVSTGVNLLNLITKDHSNYATNITWYVPMITGKFHSHITIQPENREQAEIAAKLTYGKVTFIDLAGTDHTQTDYMITHHYVTGHRDLIAHEDVTLRLLSHAQAIEKSGIQIVRIKLEHEIYDSRTPIDCVADSITTGAYTEVHIKMRGVRKDYPGWSYSTNALAKPNEYFLTRRFHASENMHVAVDLIPERQMVEVKYEVALLDTNPELDNWWCSKVGSTV